MEKKFVRTLKGNSFFEKEKVYRWKDLLKLLGSRTSVLQHVEHGRLISLGSGFYASTKIPREEALLLAVARFFPRAVISGAGALYLHGLLGRDEGYEIEADIERSTNSRNKLVRFHRVTPSRQVGIMETRVQGFAVRVYDPERSLAECFLRKWPKSRLQTVLKNYLRKSSVNLERIREYDELLGTKVEGALLKARVPVEYMEPDAEVSPLTESLVLAAVQAYCDQGSQGLSPDLIAQRAGVSKAAVLRHYPTKKDVEKAVYDAFSTKATQTAYAPLLDKKAPPLEFIMRSVDAYLEMADADESGFRFQCWAVAEKNPLTHIMFEDLCSSFIQLIKQKILEIVPRLSPYEAEVRAIFLGSVLDQYTHMRWLYAGLLKTNLSKHDMLRTYKMMIRDVLVPMCLREPDPLFQPEELSPQSFSEKPRKFLGDR